jgi:uncharacterized linocin/CFP29 family protein
MLCGNPILDALGKGTRLLPPGPMLALACVFFLEMNHSVFANYLTTLNRVPFMASAIASGVATVALALVFCGFGGMGVWGLILAQGLVQASYNNWKWPREALRDVDIGLASLMRQGGGAFVRALGR